MRRMTRSNNAGRSATSGAVSALWVLLLAPALALAQADYAREKRWADEIAPTIVVGDVVYLELMSGREFALGLSGEFTEPATLKAPVLDLFGEKDLPAVLDSAGKRAAAIRGIRGSGQLQVAGADHFFAGLENELVRQVRLFLDRRLK